MGKRTSSMKIANSERWWSDGKQHRPVQQRQFSSFDLLFSIEPVFLLHDRLISRFSSCSIYSQLHFPSFGPGLWLSVSSCSECNRKASRGKGRLTSLDLFIRMEGDLTDWHIPCFLVSQRSSSHRGSLSRMKIGYLTLRLVNGV